MVTLADPWVVRIEKDGEGRVTITLDGLDTEVVSGLPDLFQKLAVMCESGSPDCRVLFNDKTSTSIGNKLKERAVTSLRKNGALI
jgi:hypothetical protein